MSLPEISLRDSFCFARVTGGIFPCGGGIARYVCCSDSVGADLDGYGG